MISPTSAVQTLTIGELARRTGVAVGTLRMWETRHGFPVATRLPSGHRRYAGATVPQVVEVARRRDAGTRLDLAIADVVAGTAPVSPSVYATLRRLHPHLHPQRLRKSTVLALTRALEDECCAHGQRPWLFGAFQRERFYRQAQERWQELARTASGSWALAAFGSPDPDPDTSPVEVDLPADAPMRREWSFVCLAPDLPAALSAWELPGQEGAPDRDRIFETVWTLEPRAVADAARCCAHVVADLGHDTADVLRAADRPASPVATDLRQATELFHRVLSYVDRAR